MLLPQLHIYLSVPLDSVQYPSAFVHLCNASYENFDISEMAVGLAIFMNSLDFTKDSLATSSATSNETSGARARSARA